jgi:hypothetical protein
VVLLDLCQGINDAAAFAGIQKTLDADVTVRFAQTHPAH